VIFVCSRIVAVPGVPIAARTPQRWGREAQAGARQGLKSDGGKGEIRKLTKIRAIIVFSRLRRISSFTLGQTHPVPYDTKVCVWAEGYGGRVSVALGGATRQLG